jgi:flagellar basal-body rod modification protein FlgD
MSGVNGASAIGGTSSGLQTQFLNLLITQLRNQDPSNPVDNNQMTAQLATLSQLQQMENLNSSFAKILLTEQMNQATALIGHNVAFVPEGQTSQSSGKVESVKVVDGAVRLVVGPYTVDPSTVLNIN